MIVKAIKHINIFKIVRKKKSTSRDMRRPDRGIYCVKIGKPELSSS